MIIIPQAQTDPQFCFLITEGHPRCIDGPRSPRGGKPVLSGPDAAAAIIMGAGRLEIRQSSSTRPRWGRAILVLNLFVLYVRWAFVTGRIGGAGHNPVIESLIASSTLSHLEFSRLRPPNCWANHVALFVCRLRCRLYWDVAFGGIFDYFGGTASRRRGSWRSVAAGSCALPGLWRRYFS